MSRGFTLIELLIALAITGMVAAVIAGAALGNNPVNNMSFGVNGTVETRCIDGYKFMVGYRGQVSQVMDADGHGVHCN